MHEEYEAQHRRQTRGYMLSNSTYDTLKFVVTVLLPGVGTLYFALAEIWGLPYGAEVVGSIVALTAFLGLLLRGSSKSYNNSDAKYDGFIDIDEDVVDNKKTFSLVLDSNPEELEQKKDVTFKVNPLR